ncbi:hypothetical protein X961_5194 [Burkholderia pseudomallei MSHR5613]|nr:hypothetical protein X961_5194 [Burkholderia pseudomallei MSHR5613]
MTPLPALPTSKTSKGNVPASHLIWPFMIMCPPCFRRQ